MKKTAYLIAASVALILVAGALSIAPESTMLASLLDPSFGLTDAIEASPVLLTMRSDLDKLIKRAADKLAEAEGLDDDDAVRNIETDHKTILGEIDAKKAEIAAQEDAERSASVDTPPAESGTASAADIFNIGTRAGMATADIETAIRAGEDVETFRTRAFDHLASASRRTQTEPGRVLRDETETRRDALTEALSYRLGAPVPQAGVAEPARPFMEYRRFSSFIAEAIGHEGRVDSVRALDDLYDRAAHSTSDFPSIYENAVNRSLEGRYALAQPTYRRIARRSDFRDFRPHKTVKLGDFPTLLKVAENGEIKYGTFSEGKETIQAFAYARALSISRPMMVNDDLGAIADMLSSYGDTVALFEEVVFYSQGLDAKLADNKVVFHTDHGNLAAAGTAITVADVAAGRAAMSKQKSLDNNPLLSNKPRILLCGPDKITEAEMLVASITPATMANVNIFSGRLEPLETAQITDNAWYLLPGAEDGRSNYRWGLLDGYEAPRVRMDEPFGRQGFAMSVEHDFGVGATDSRFGYKNPGA